MTQGRSFYRCEPTIVSRKSVLSGRASGLIEAELPLRSYCFSVGGALLLLLLAADWVLPAPLPGRFAGSGPVLPTIRIHSDVKRPEAVTIETSRPVAAVADSMRAADLSRTEDAAVVDAARPPGSPEYTDVAKGDRFTGPTNPRLRDSTAELAPAATEPAGPVGRPGEVRPAAERKLAQSRKAKWRRSVHAPKLDRPVAWCIPTRERGFCHDILTPHRTNQVVTAFQREPQD